MTPENAWIYAVLPFVTMAVLTTYNVYDKAGSCLSADRNGGCEVRATD